MLAVLWRWGGAQVRGASITLNLDRLVLHQSLIRSTLALLELPLVLLLCGPLQGCVPQQHEVTEVLAGEELWRSGRRRVEEPVGETSCRGHAGDRRGDGPLFLSFPQ